MAERSCQHCGGTFTAQRSTARYCSSGCRAKATEARRQAAVVAELGARPTVETPSVSSAVRAELAAVDRLMSSAGAAALALAARIDAQAESGASVAALVKQLHATMAEATKDVRVAADPLDELQARREARRGA